MPDNPYQRSDPTWWDSVKDNLGALDVNDITGFPQWLAGATRPAPESQGWGPQGWQAQADWQKEQMDANPMAFIGATNIIGKPGGNRIIQSLDDATGRLRGELGYKDVPGKGAIIQSFRSQAPEATREMYGAFNQEMGPLLDRVKVQGNIRPEAWQSVEGALNRGIYDETPNLAEQWRRALAESQNRYPNPGDIQPERWNPYAR